LPLQASPAAAVDGSVAAVSQSLAQPPTPVVAEHGLPTVAPAPSALVPQPPVTFEDAISAMLRPMLRDWLDDNMPRMVEKALKEEMAGSDGVVAQAARLAAPAG
jgi:hypothetical protein